MPLIDPDKSAHESFLLKKRLEKRFTRNLEDYLGDVLVEFTALYSERGSIIQASEFSDDLRGVLVSNYRRVSRNFNRQLITAIRNNPDDALTQNLKLIATRQGITLKQLLLKLRNNVVINSGELVKRSVVEDVANITRTTQRHMDEAVEKAIATLAEASDQQATIREIADEASTTLKNRIKGRASNISATGTQKIAEGTREIELQEVLQTRNDIEHREVMKPLEDDAIWVSQGDSLVRDGKFNHQLADGQKRENGIYIVSGEQLRYPGDSSLGASVGNLAHCRCSSVLIIDDKVGV